MTGRDNILRSLQTEGDMLGMRYRLVTIRDGEGDGEVLVKQSFASINDFLDAAETMKKQSDRLHHFEMLCSRGDDENEQWLGIDLSSAPSVPMELHHVYGVDNLPDSIKAQIGLQARGEDTYPVTVVGGFDWFLIPCALEISEGTTIDCTMLELDVRYINDVHTGQRVRVLGACLHSPKIKGISIADIDLRSLSYVDAIIDDHSDYWLLQDMDDPKAPYLEPLEIFLAARLKEESK